MRLHLIHQGMKSKQLDSTVKIVHRLDPLLINSRMIPHAWMRSKTQPSQKLNEPSLLHPPHLNVTQTQAIVNETKSFTFALQTYWK